MPLQACGQTSAPPDIPEGAIAFKNDPDVGATSSSDEQDIFVLEPDSNRVWRLTNNSVPEFSLSWSPNGRRLLYLIDTKGSPSRIDGSQQGDRRIAVMDLQDLSVEYLDLFWARPEGPDIERDHPWIERVAWSPTDTSTFAAVVRIDRKREGAIVAKTSYSVILLNQSSRSVRTLAEPRLPPYRLFWSCDGTKLAYQDPRSREPRVFNTKTGEQISLPTSKTESSPDNPVGVHGWTPDGTQLLVGDRTSTSTFPVYGAHLSNKSWRQLANLDGDISDVQSVSAEHGASGSSTALAILKPVGPDGYDDIWMYNTQRESYHPITNDRGRKGEITPYIAPCGSRLR
ncbi:TolB family protein [Longibacter salinarum]|uniref:TolB family protein n=1 Tax=Longibacter salinarum TaxID=1850348 RepID=UPI0015CF084C|nr:PD40 domain-containing protein [Longibacter salinarum]